MAGLIRLCIVQPVIPSYRTELFNRISSLDGVSLTVFAGHSTRATPTGDEVSQFRFVFRHAPWYVLGPVVSQRAQLSVVQSGEFDVAIFNWNVRSIELVPALKIAARRGVRTVVWGHGRGAFSSATVGREDRVRNWIRDRVLDNADACLLYSKGVAEEFRESGVDPGRIFVAQNALDQEPVASAQHNWATQEGALARFTDEHGIEGQQLLIYIGRLEPHKQLDTLIDSVAILARTVPAICVVIIGGGSERAQLESKVYKLDLGRHVRFLGGLYSEEQIAPWCMMAKACVFPGNAGLGLLHAFGYGLPVVTSDAGQTPEIEALVSGRNGLLFSSGNAACLAFQLKWLLERPALRTTMAEEARRTVVGDGYTLDRMVSGLESAVRTLGSR